MQVKQWITNPAVNVVLNADTQPATQPVPTALGGNPFGQFGAFRIALQALPGTLFCVKGTGSEMNIVMGPTGIYELGFSRALIKDFCIKETVGDTKSAIILLDALIATTNDESANPYNQALLAENYDTSESTIRLWGENGECACCTWDIAEESSEPPAEDDQDHDPEHEDGTWIVEGT